MVVYQNRRNNQGGKPGEMLKNMNSSIWTQLKAPNNNKMEYLNALDAKFMDHDINTSHAPYRAITLTHSTIQ